MTKTEILEGPKGRAVITISLNPGRACLDWYCDSTNAVADKIVGGEGPFPDSELKDRLAVVRQKVKEALA